MGCVCVSVFVYAMHTICVRCLAVCMLLLISVFAHVNMGCPLIAHAFASALLLLYLMVQDRSCDVE